MTKKVYLQNNILFKIHNWHHLIKAILNKIEYGLVSVYKTLYMQNVIWF